MNYIAGKIARALSMGFYDVLNLVVRVFARFKTLFWYSFFFESIGSASWLRAPSLLYGTKGIRIGNNVRIESGATLYSVRKAADEVYSGRIVIGDRVFLNQGANITSAFFIQVGADVAFGPNVFVTDFDHEYRIVGVSRLKTPLVSKGAVIIGDRCWIGANAVICSGVSLGDDCVVGANSVVKHSFPAGTVIAGAPAVAIRKYDSTAQNWIPISFDETHSNS